MIPFSPDTTPKSPKVYSQDTSEEKDNSSNIAAKTGKNNIRLNRPSPSNSQTEANKMTQDYDADKVRQEGLSARFYEAMFDFLRQEMVVTTYDLEKITAMLFPSNHGYGINETVASLDNKFVLVAGIKQYSKQLKDMDTGGLIGIEPILEIPTDINPQILLYLMRNWTLAIYDGIDNTRKIKYRICLNLGGQWCRRHDLLSLWRIAQYLNQFNPSTMRIDPKIDSPLEDRIRPQALEYALAGKMQGKRKFTPKCGQLDARNPDYDRAKGVQIASRESDSCGRHYNNELIHNLESDRTEQEFKKRQAKQIWDEFVNLSPYRDPNDKMSRMPDKDFRVILQQWLANITLGQYDFCDELVYKKGNGAIKRKVVAKFWQEFRKKCQAYKPRKITTKAPQRTIEKSNRSLTRNAKQHAMWREGLGRQWYSIKLNEAMDKAMERLTDQDKKFIEAIKQHADVIIANVKGVLDLGDLDRAIVDAVEGFSRWVDDATYVTRNQLSELKKHWSNKKTYYNTS